MARTAQDLIEQARLKEQFESREAKVVERATKIAKADIRKESIDRFKSYFSRPMPVSRSVKRTDTKVGAVARKAIHLVSPKGFVKEITRPKGVGKGRGRPKKSYKLRFVPGIGAVRVPTAIYNKMMSAAKAKQRLAAAQRQANIQQQYEAEQIAMQQDPRFQPKDSFLEAPDMQHEQAVMQAEQQVSQEQSRQQQIQQMEQEQRPSIAARAGQMFSNVGKISLMGTDRQQQVQGYGQQVPQIRRPDVSQIHRPQIDPNLHQPRSPQVLVTSGRSPMFSSGGPSILSQGNEFNRRDEATIGFGR